MRTLTTKIAERGADLVLVGNGTVEMAREYVDETGIEFRLVVDPELNGYRAATLQRRLMAPYQPKAWWKGVGAWRRGFRLGRTNGDNYQLGGLFVMCPDQTVAYAHVSQQVYDKPPLSDVLAVLERLQTKSWAEPRP